MKRSFARPALGLLVLAALCAAGCKTRSVDQERFIQGDSYAGEMPYRKVLLVGLDASTRGRLENDLEGRLASGGTQAVSSHETWKRVADIERERELETFVEKYEVEAVVTIALIDAQAASSIDLARAGSSGIVSTLEAGLKSQPEDDFVVEVVVWSARDFVPIWVGHSEVYPQKLRKKPDEVADFVVEVLQERKIVKFMRSAR